MSNGATGTATVNLRGLGSARTLVLINGRRLQPGDPTSGRSPDINFIPSTLIKRVDVLTGGASSVYGADAVAGVVNFIMDTNYRGFRIDAQASAFNHNNTATDDRGQSIACERRTPGFRPPHGMSTNGGAQDISGAFGAGFDDNRGSVMAYATYRKQDAGARGDSRLFVLRARRRGPGLLRGQSGSDYGKFYCGGSSTSATGRSSSCSIRCDRQPFRSTAHIGRRQPVRRRRCTLFNFAPYNYFQRPDERYTFGAFAEYEISPGAKPYLEAMFMDDQSDAQIAPSGRLQQRDLIELRQPAAVGAAEQRRSAAILANLITGSLSTGMQTSSAGDRVLSARRNVEGGGRDDDLEHTDMRIVAGIAATCCAACRTTLTTSSAPRALADLFQRLLGHAPAALDRRHRDPAVASRAGVPAGTPVCRCGLLTGIDPNCVPWNIFTTGGVTPEALAYLQTPGLPARQRQRDRSPTRT